MTTIACWFNKEKASRTTIWLAGDGKISNKSGTTLLNSATKIFALTAHYYTWEPFQEELDEYVKGEVLLFSQSAPSTCEASTRLVAQGNLAFAFAGNALAAHNTFAIINFLFSHIHVQPFPPEMPVSAELLKLNRVTQAGVPALEGLVQLVADVYKSEIMQIGVALPSITGELAIAGYCPVDEEHQIYHLKTAITPDGLSIEVEKHTEHLAPSGWALFLGAARQRMELNLAQIRARHLNTAAPAHLWHRAPLSAVLNATASEAVHHSIGGHSQVGIVNKTKFSPFRLAGADAHGNWPYGGQDTAKNVGFWTNPGHLVLPTLDVTEQLGDAAWLTQNNAGGS